MEKILFDNSTYIWKTKLKQSEKQSIFLKEIDEILNAQRPEEKYRSAYVFMDVYNMKDTNIEIKRELDNVIKTSIDISLNIVKENDKINFNTIHIQTWVQRVFSKNPFQASLKLNKFFSEKIYHRHDEINKKKYRFKPIYTYVYYVQMPEYLRNNSDDGRLYLKGDNEIEYSILPEEDDLIIMPANLEHSPMSAPEASKDRIVVAGNVGIEFIKKSNKIL
jgi:hypothetical protein